MGTCSDVFAAVPVFAGLYYIRYYVHRLQFVSIKVVEVVVYPKIKKSFSHPHVVLNPYDSLSSVECSFLVYEH